MAGTPSKRLAAKRVTTKELKEQLDGLKEQVNNLPPGIDRAQLISELDAMLADVFMLGIREESADKANFPLLQQTVALEAAEQEERFRAFAHDHALQLQAVENRLNGRINGQATEIGMLNQGQQSLHKRVSVLEGSSFVTVVLAFFAGAIAGIFAVGWYWAQPNTTATGDVLVGVGIGAIVMALILLMVDAVRRIRHKPKAAKVDEPDTVELDQLMNDPKVVAHQSKAST